MTFTENFTVHPLGPFDFDLSAQIFSSGDPQIRSYVNGVFYQVLKINGNLVLVKLSSKGTIEQPRIGVELKSNKLLTPKDNQTVEDAVYFIFNLDFDLCNFYEDVENDLVMHHLAKQLYGLKSPTTPTVFESLVDSIVEQQISLKVAQSMEKKIVKKFGESLTIDGNVYFAYPTPQSIADSSISEIQQVGLSLRKAEYILNAAKLIVDGKLDLEQLKGNPNPEQIIAELDAVRGIGVWTAELTMLRGMQRLDALPADDLGLRRIISMVYRRGKPINAAETREIAKAWGKWKGLAAFYLIIAEIKGIKI
jgi:DNA-3-methyladenine glycosylase II